jgi:hypothetical protein
LFIWIRIDIVVSLVCAHISLALVPEWGYAQEKCSFCIWLVYV